MPAQVTPRITHWVGLNTFSPGLFSNTNIAGIEPVVPAPPGAADARYTVGCMALTNGGLGPLPKIVKTYEYTGTLPFSTYTKFYIWQFYTIANYTAGAPDRLIVAFQGTDGTDRNSRTITYRTTVGHVLSTGTWATTKKTTILGPSFPQMVRIAKTTPTTKVGNPELALMVMGTKTGDVVTFVGVYPNLTKPTTPTITILAKEPNAQVIGFQGRILALKSDTYTWPGGVYSTNEAIDYTTPSNSKTLGTQHIILDPTDPFGYGTWGSISAGELFLIKNREGGLLMTGDINYPTVTKLPGIQPTGHCQGPGGQTPEGLFYCSQANGAWLWDGGNISEKVSTQIDDDFYINTEIFSGNFNCMSWGQWVLFSNNWIYNMQLNSWWKWDFPHACFWFGIGREAEHCYFAKPFITATTKDFAFKVTKTTPTTTYTWQSLPIKVANNKYINIREIVLYASNNTTATSTVNIKLYNDGTQIETLTTEVGQIGADPSMIRIPAGGVTLENITIRLTATGTNGAPIIHSLTIGMTVRQHVETTAS